MADQTVTLHITANADGLVTAVGLAKKETSGLGTAGASAGAQVNAGMSDARKGVQSISEQLGRAKQQLIGFAAGFASIHGVRQLAAIADQAAGIRAQLQLATSSTQEYASAQAEVFAISQRTSTAMASTAELYARITRSTAEYGIEQARVLAMTETINQTFAVSGTAAAAQANAITQLTQAFAGGVLRAEEFNSVIENSPRLAQALADGMGVGMGELRAQVNAGTVDVQRMIAALESQAEAIATEFGRMPLTIERAWTQIGNAILKYVGDADAASGASREIAEALSWVADHIGEIIEGAWALGKALAAIYTAKLLSQAALYTAELARQITLQLAAASAARDMGIKTQAGLAASLKSIGLVNAALGSLGAAVAGWQVGTYLRTQFVEVERFGIAMVGGLLKAWESLKFYSKVLWEGIKASAIGALNVVRTAAADMIGALAKVNEATDVFGIKSGVTESLRQMEGQIRPTSSAWAGLAAAVGTAAKQMYTSNAAIDKSMMALWESAGAAEAADEASGNLGKTLTGTGAAAKESATAIENLYTHTARLTDATDNVDAMLRSLAYGLADEATRALMDYEDVQARILELEMAWLDLGPMSEAQIAKLAELRRLAAEGHARNMADLNDGTVREAQRAAQESARAWEDFTGGLADAILDGSAGVKRWWKAMLDDMKRQLIQSGLLKIFGQIFNTGGAQAGSGFGSMFAAMLGGGMQAGRAASMGGVGFGQLLQLGDGSLLSSLAGAISGGISTGLMGFGGTLAGLGMGSLGGGLAWAGGSIASSGSLLGGLGSSFMTGLGNLFGAGGGAMMGIGQMIPAIAAAAAIAAAIQKLSGGKLFGTSYGFDSAAQNIDFSGAGVDGNSTVTEVRQRSLFRGRKWRTTSSALDDEVRGPLEDFWNAVLDSNTAIARQFGRAAAIDVPASFRQEFNAKGDVTAEIGTILGRQYRETWEVFAQRITAENIIANIDGMLGMLGTLAPAPGTGGGGGGGSRRRGDDYDQLASLGGAVPLDVQAQVGEASAIAERWRHDAELLAEGAQFLLLAASDIRAGAGLLGDDGTLTQITALIEDLQASGETLSATYARVAGSAALLDQALALSGVQIDGTREHIVRLATDITTAAGGLERASALWGAYFDRFYTDAERLQFMLTQAQASAAKEFADIGLDAADFEGVGGISAFRELFEAALPSLSADAIVQWLEAAAALGIVIDTTDALNELLGQTGVSAAALAEALEAYNDFIDQFRPDETLPTGADAGSVAEAQAQADAWAQAMIDQANALAIAAGLAGAAEEDLALIHQRAAEYAATAAARLRAAYDDFIGQFRPDETLPTGADAGSVAEAQAQADAWAQAMIDQANALAIAAGLAGAAEEDLALIHQRAAEYVAQAAERIDAAHARGAAAYTDFIGSILRETQHLSAYQASMRDADAWRTDAIAKAHEHARAAGMAGASEQALALIELRASQLRAQALAQLREETQSLVDQLYGAGGTGIGDAFSTGVADAGNAAADYWAAQRRSAETLQNYLDSMLLGDLSALTPEQQLAEAWEQLNAAVTAGDADQATRLADVYLRMLRGMEASGDDYNQGFWGVRELLQGMLAGIGAPPEDEPGGGGGGGGYITAAGAEQIAARNRLELAAQLAQHLADLAGAVGQTVWELMDSMGVDLRQLTADLGISLQDITGETVLALVNMAGLLGTNLLDLTSELGLQLTDLGGGIRELAENTGINLDALTVQSTQALGALANQLGIDLADIAASVGVDLGSLADAQSLLNQALAAQINQLPGGTGDALAPYLNAIAQATSEADATAAIDAMAGYINTLAPDIRNALAPYFADVFPADALSDLDYLTQIATDGAAQLAAAQAANALLARIADNAAAANVAADIPSYAVGTWRVPQTGPAILHAGEMVLPVPLARVLRGAGGRGGQDGGDTRALLEELRRIGEKVDRLERSGRGNTQELVTAIDSTGERSDRERDLALSRHNIGPRGRTP